MWHTSRLITPCMFKEVMMNFVAGRWVVRSRMPLGPRWSMGAMCCIALMGCVAVAAGAGDYVGSARCAECHEGEANSWRHSLHSRFLRSVADAASQEAFDLAAMKPPFPAEDAKYVMGNMYKQLFLTGIGKDGRFLPFQYDVTARKWEPLTLSTWDYGHTNHMVAADPAGSWHARCAGCHVTAYDPANGSFRELSIGCEDCHGPGRAHSESPETHDVLNSALLEGPDGNKVCARCHSHGYDTASGTPYPGSRGEGNSVLPSSYVLTRPDPRGSNEVFLAEGYARRHHAQWNEFAASAHYKKGIRCYDCHDVHRWREVAPSKHTKVMAKTERVLLKSRAAQVCLRCHSDRGTERVKGKSGEWVDAHTRHPEWLTITEPDPVDGRPRERQIRMTCRDCHMPRVNQSHAGYVTSSHSFRTVMPLESAKIGIKDVCTDCHTDRKPAWAQEQIEQWQPTKPHPLQISR